MNRIEKQILKEMINGLRLFHTKTCKINCSDKKGKILNEKLACTCGAASHNDKVEEVLSFLFSILR